MAANKLPAVVIIARHGARLDAADKQWHFTSPTPYDPPLTYGGWTQSRALGARISTILQAQEDTQDEQAKESNSQGGEATPRRRKRYKVIIHSSPFVRCVQTSIAISAGLAQYQKKSNQSSLPRSGLSQSTTHSTESEISTGLAVIPEPTVLEPPNIPQAIPPPQKLRITKLRVDAFLGEWLSPDYFEQITPPPGSIMMVAGAKAELLRPGERIEGSDLGNKIQGHFPGGWKSDMGESSTTEEEDHKGLDNLNSISSALPRSRANTTSSNVPTRPRISTNINSSSDNYVPPTPTYAVSSSDPIPPGYVAHARDACVDVDFRWDSMRPPQDWGNGGEYGEEWGSMHKRFRSGFQKMVGWYKEQPNESEDDDTDVETVLILVTHGAGCNALIGALTNQPVLLDVGMASLTMAVRKDTVEPSASKPPGTISPIHSRKSSLIDTSIAEEYDVKLMASTDHLRGGTTPMSPAAAPSPRSASTPWRRNFSVSSTDFMGDDTRPTSQGVHRSSSNAMRNHAAIINFKQSSGLWGSSSTDAASESSDSDSMPNFGNADGDSSDSFVEAIRKSELGNGDIKVSPAPVSPISASQRGLWGGGSSPRESLAKRRWTVNEPNA